MLSCLEAVGRVWGGDHLLWPCPSLGAGLCCGSLTRLVRDRGSDGLGWSRRRLGLLLWLLGLRLLCLWLLLLLLGGLRSVLCRCCCRCWLRLLLLLLLLGCCLLCRCSKARVGLALALHLSRPLAVCPTRQLCCTTVVALCVCGVECAGRQAGREGGAEGGAAVSMRTCNDLHQLLYNSRSAGDSAHSLLHTSSVPVEAQR
jgi:hypothetical protein